MNKVEQVGRRVLTRPAAEDDHKALVALAKTSKYTKDFSNAVMFSSPAAYAKGWIRMAVDEDTREVLGLTCVRHKARAPRTMLYFIVVAEEARGEGLGERMLTELMERGPHDTLELNVMKENSAVEFYRRLGFTVEAEAMKGQAWRMVKTYSP